MNDQECLTLYPLDYSKIGAINSFDEIVDGNAFGDCLIKSNVENRVSASLLYNEERDKCYVLILGNDHKEQVKFLKECGINLGNPLRKFNSLKDLISKESSEEFYSLDSLNRRVG
jgi:hypothetical protein